MTTFNLEKAVLPAKTVTFEYPGLDGLEFNLAYLSKDELQKVMKKCTKQKFDRKARQLVDEVDNDLFLKVYVKAIIKGWNGFKFKFLSNFLVWDETQIDNLEDEFEFSVDNAITLMKNSTEFDTWVSEQIGELANFTQPSSSKKLN